MKKIFFAVIFTVMMICSICSANLKVTMLNVGQGDAILIQTSEQNVLIDTSDFDERDKLKRELYKAGAYRLDKIILTHPHADHIGNCAFLIKNGVFKVKSVYDNGVISTSKFYQNYIAECKRLKVPHKSLAAGDVLDLGEGAKFTVIYPPREMVDALNTYTLRGDSNNEGIVGRLTYGNFSMLFTGDAEAIVENDLLLQIEPCTVLKAPHHGSSTSSTLNFVKAVNPEYVFISAGKPTTIRGGNTYGHPHTQALQNYLKAGVDPKKILWTYPQGTITLLTDGITTTVTTEKPIDWLYFYLMEKSDGNVTEMTF